MFQSKVLHGLDRLLAVGEREAVKRWGDIKDLVENVREDIAERKASGHTPCCHSDVSDATPGTGKNETS